MRAVANSGLCLRGNDVGRCRTGDTGGTRPRHTDGSTDDFFVTRGSHGKAFRCFRTLGANSAQGAANTTAAGIFDRGRIDPGARATARERKARAVADIAVIGTITIRIDRAGNTAGQRRHRPRRCVVGCTGRDRCSCTVAPGIDHRVVPDIGACLAGNDVRPNGAADGRRACPRAAAGHRNEQRVIAGSHDHVAVRIDRRCGLGRIVASRTDIGLGGIGDDVHRCRATHGSRARPLNRDAGRNDVLRRGRIDDHVIVGSHRGAFADQGGGFFRQRIDVEHAAHGGRARPSARSGHGDEVAVAVSRDLHRALGAGCRRLIDVSIPDEGRSRRGHDIHCRRPTHAGGTAAIAGDTDVNHGFFRLGLHRKHTPRINFRTIANTCFRRIVQQGHAERPGHTGRTAPRTGAIGVDGESRVFRRHGNVAPGLDLGAITDECLRVLQRHVRTVGHCAAHRELAHLAVEYALGFRRLLGAAKGAADLAAARRFVGLGLRRRALAVGIGTLQTALGIAIEQRTDGEDRHATSHTGSTTAGPGERCRIHVLVRRSMHANIFRRADLGAVVDVGRSRIECHRHRQRTADAGSAAARTAARGCNTDDAIRGRHIDTLVGGSNRRVLVDLRMFADPGFGLRDDDVHRDAADHAGRAATAPGNGNAVHVLGRVRRDAGRSRRVGFRVIADARRGGAGVHAH